MTLYQTGWRDEQRRQDRRLSLGCKVLAVLALGFLVGALLLPAAPLIDYALGF